jgi:hypothetical protein
MKINMGDVRGEDDARGGAYVDSEGLFHILATAVDDSADKVEAVIVDMKVLAGTDASQVGKGYREYFYTSDSAIKRLKLFGLVTGAARPGQPFQVKDLIGKQAVIEIKKSSYTKDGETKTKFKTGWDTFWRLDDAKVAHVPRGTSKVVSDIDADLAGLDDDDDDDDWATV